MTARGLAALLVGLALGYLLSSTVLAPGPQPPRLSLPRWAADGVREHFQRAAGVEPEEPLSVAVNRFAARYDLGPVLVAGPVWLENDLTGENYRLWCGLVPRGIIVVDVDDPRRVGLIDYWGRRWTMDTD